MATAQKKRIWGWMFFDWAQQPYFTLGLTFIFGPYFAGVATELFLSQGLTGDAADAKAQSLWAVGQLVAGLFIAVTAPFLGAFADNSGRKIPWIAVFSVIYVIASMLLWRLMPNGQNLIMTLVIFYIGFFAAESALNFANAILPSLGSKKEVGRISGSAAAFGYWGGVAALLIMLPLMVEDSKTGLTMLGNPPLFGLDASQMQGTRSVGPFIGIWYAIFMIPFFMWVRDDKRPPSDRTSLAKVTRELKATLRSVYKRKSVLNFLVGSMFYRDALNALYAFGGVYAKLVLEWETISIGIFGIVAAIAAAITTWIGGLFDQRHGPKPVIKVSIWVLIAVSTTIVFMDRDSIFGFTLAEGSTLPDTVLFICGACIGGAGGALYSASRSMMVRHAHPDRPAEAFGLFALSGKATAFLAPAGIFIFTMMTGSAQLGFLPVIFLFLIGLYLLRYVNKDGEPTV
ncbi:MAG: MFS transporter [Rhodobacteraceae bacterium]|nr:MFS transporter [Paracoccaceae bacterium]